MTTAKTKKTKPAEEKSVSLASIMSKKPIFSNFDLWLVGDTPLITHAWSEKARREMLQKQIGAAKPGKEPRKPEEDFVNSLYSMGDDTFGFPATGVKNCIISAAHKDKGINKTTTRQALWIDADMTRVQPALAGAVCDVPLLKIYGTDPEMREDMVRIGGINKTATLAYRGQFTVWAMRITGRLNQSVLSAENLAYLIQDAGMAFGLGEWRNEKNGMFGAFHLADTAEEKAWDAFAAGKGSLPLPAEYREAAE